jgi:hypothetical protein
MAFFSVGAISSGLLMRKPLAPNASAYLTTSKGPKRPLLGFADHY